MRRVLAASALALLGLAPAIGSACEYSASMAATAAPAQLAAAPIPEATNVATATAAKAPAPKAAIQASGKAKEPAPDAKLAVAPTN